ncbi:hypothetical protein KC686_01465 [Candidatus Woesebacteria bacterium]|nr:hypothetical protein [Candidatus Woesebacteria bacterium]
MPKAHDILGMNARNSQYISQNNTQAKSVASSKYATKILLEDNNIPTPKIYAILATNEDVQDFDWKSIEGSFVVKPTNGHAGKGVLILNKKSKHTDTWSNTLGQQLSPDDIKLHCSDILEGQYSTWGSQHNVIVEERILTHPVFKKYTYKGTPDIRVVVFNQVPIMALLRLPTKESEGRANQSQGAIGVGIDIATGVTTFAAANLNEPISYLPGTKFKLNGIKIPQWKSLLHVAVRAAEASNLYYSGIDLFLDADQGPMVVEINSSPGLSIQNANRSGLKRRLERVEGLNVRNPEHGVRIGQALFASNFADKIKSEEGLQVLSPFETVVVTGEDKQTQELLALMNTGRYRTAIATSTAETLGLIDIEDLLWFQQETGEGKIPVVEVTFKLGRRKITTSAVVSKRLNRGKYRMEIGRKDLSGFLVGDSNTS